MPDITEAMLAHPVPGLDPVLNQWVARHNRCLADYAKGRVGHIDGRNLTRHERAILSLADGIEQYVGSAADHADPLSSEYLFRILDGFGGLLNYDTGRLQPGVLSSWAVSVAERWGFNPDTGEWISGA